MDSLIQARGLRRIMPVAQRRLWRVIRDRRFAGYKFRREHPVGDYILDFYCAEAKLSIELDGRQHGSPEQEARDRAKESYLLSRGILTKRFWNRQVLQESEVVKENLWRILQERAPHAGNVPVTAEARSRTWRPRGHDAPVPLRAEVLPRRTR